MPNAPSPIQEILHDPDVIKSQIEAMKAINDGKDSFEVFARLTRNINEAAYPELRVQRQKKEN